MARYRVGIETRTRILDAVRHLLGDVGFDGTTLKAITDRAPFPFITKVRVVASGLSSDGPLIGAASLVHHPERLSTSALEN